MRDLVIPLHVARSATLVGGSATAMKALLLVLDRLHASASEPPRDAPTASDEPPLDDTSDTSDDDTSDDDACPVAYEGSLVDDGAMGDGVPVRVPMRDLVAVTGAVEWSVRRSLTALQTIGYRLPALDVEGEVEVEAYRRAFSWAGGGLREGEGASVAVELDADFAAWCLEAPDHRGIEELVVPMSELRALQTRTGVLLLLRGLAQLQERQGRNAVRCRADATGMPWYTGHHVSRGRAPSLRAYVDDYLAPGAAEVNVSSSMLRVAVEPVEARVRERAEGHEVRRPTRYRYLDVTFDHVRRHRVTTASTVDASEVAA